MKQILKNQVGENTYSFIGSYVDIESIETLIISTTNVFNVLNHPIKINTLVNLSKVNNIRYINKFFEAVNSRLQTNETFIVCCETITARKERQAIGRISLIKNMYFILEFIFLRVFPKLWGLKKIYFLITKGRNRLLSKSEVMGRLVSCGFEIIDSKAFNGITYIVTKKVSEPSFNMNVSYGPLFKMKRIGKNGKIFRLYKFRTMHPYAECIQKYVYETNGTISGDKPNNDFRLTPWGRVLRKLWLDELPQIVNICKGEMKIVGVRPLSEHKFSMYPSEVQKRRILFKPGLIPPFYVDMPNNLDEIVSSEMKYFDAYEKKPFLTDLKYFFKAFYNIIFKHKRSA